MAFTSKNSFFSLFCPGRKDEARVYVLLVLKIVARKNIAPKQHLLCSPSNAVYLVLSKYIYLASVIALDWSKNENLYQLQVF